MSNTTHQTIHQMTQPTQPNILGKRRAPTSSPLPPTLTTTSPYQKQSHMSSTRGKQGPSYHNTPVEPLRTTGNRKREVWWKDHLSMTNQKTNNNTSSKSQENLQQRNSPRTPFQEPRQQTTKRSSPTTITHLHHQSPYKPLTIRHHKYSVHPQD